MKDRAVFDAFTLKLLMAAAMLLDHLYYFLPGMPIWFTCIGRIVAPTFCFLAVESLLHTRNRKRFIQRLCIAGFIMLAGNIILVAVFGKMLTNSIFLSLAIGTAMVDTLDRISKNGAHALTLLRIPVLILLSSFVEGVLLIPILSVVFYLLREQKALMCVVFAASSTLYFYLSTGISTPDPRYNLTLSPGLSIHVQYLQVLAIIPILLYNGLPGSRGAFSRRFFYVFYPLHIWALYLVSVLVY